MNVNANVNLDVNENLNINVSVNFDMPKKVEFQVSLTILRGQFGPRTRAKTLGRGAQERTTSESWFG